MNKARLDFFKKGAAFFRQAPEATQYLGVSRPTWFSLLALSFSTPEEILDPTTPDFLARAEEKISFFEEKLNQNQPPPETVPLPKELAETTQRWQNETTQEKPLPQLEKIGKPFEGKLKNASLRAWKKIKPGWISKITQFLGKGKILGKAVGALGKAAGVVGFALAAVGISAGIIKKAIKYLGIPLMALYAFFSALGIGALIGATAGGIIGGLAGGIGGAILGAKLGAVVGAAVGGPIGAVVGGVLGGITGFVVGSLGGAIVGVLTGGTIGYAIEHWIWRPVQGAWTAAGNFLSGLWSGFWTGAANFFSGALSWFGNAATSVGSFFANLGGQLAGVSIAEAATLPTATAVAVGTGATLFVGSLVVGTSFMNQPPGSEGAPGSQYIEAQKSVAPKSNFATSELPTTVTYTLTITPREGKLLNVQVNDQTSVTKEGSPPSVAPRSWPVVSEIATSWEETYDLALTSDFADSAVTNVVTVTADVEGGPSGQTTSASSTITIGSPPQDCPSGWPTDTGYLTQGPEGGTSHIGYEAVDIGVAYAPVFATHQGRATVLSNECRGNYVEIVGLCGGREFTSRYLHLSTIEITNGMVNKGTRIGVSGNTGTCTYGFHLHYQFYNLLMGSPYIPVSRESILGCDSDTANQCNVSW